MIIKSRDIKLAKIMMYLIPSPQKRTEWLKKKKVFYNMGNNCYYHTRDIPSEPYLLNIHNNVRIAANVRFITHDTISLVIDNIPKYYEKNGRMKYYIGSIEIFDNVMIGANTTILYDVKIGPNAIIAAGSVVTKDVPEGTVVGGNPARVICSFDDFVNKRFRKNKSRVEKTDGINNVIDFFWNQSND
ncbi:acyltransferase [Clostridium perfringens]|uniref:acyltransferase n=1 Tax=Clostridium perfringens TaxID=1502 RepID=UPI0029019000|nr:acyltransferase [Clostridium perfringens]EHA1184361.1 acyltransferase [Clostridium perfringens]EHK2367095.1 acyltransferase [Clostridium perfringens]MDU2325157.1 acyltransferase [Clostridium perfringens]